MKEKLKNQSMNENTETKLSKGFISQVDFIRKLNISHDFKVDVYNKLWNNFVNDLNKATLSKHGKFTGTYKADRLPDLPDDKELDKLVEGFKNGEFKWVEPPKSKIRR